MQHTMTVVRGELTCAACCHVEVDIAGATSSGQDLLQRVNHLQQQHQQSDSGGSSSSREVVAAVKVINGIDTRCSATPDLWRRLLCVCSHCVWRP